jgi:hypothetical protein
LCLRARLLLYIVAIMVPTKDGKFFTPTKQRLPLKEYLNSPDLESMSHSSLFQDYQ